MASAITSSPYSIASLMALDPVKQKVAPANGTMEKHEMSSSESDIEHSASPTVLENGENSQMKSANRCSCFACTQPSAFSPFKSTLGPGSEGNPFASIPGARSFADYFYIPTKGQ